MSHHSQGGLNPELDRIAKEMGLGATKDFPAGKLNASDEGGLKLAVTHTDGPDGRVIVHFGTQVVWIGFTRDEAIALAKMITTHAESLPS